MTPGCSWAEAIATVVVANVLVWIFILWLVPADAFVDLWPAFLIVSVITLPLIFLVYYRHWEGPGDKRLKSSKYHIIAAIAFSVAAIAYAVSAIYEEHRHGWSLIFRLAIAAGWLLASVQNIHYAIRAKAMSTGA